MKPAETALLQMQLRMATEALDRLRCDPGDLPVTGCGATSCVVARPQGMATNGGCRCDERTLRWTMQYWRSVATFRQTLIEELRGEVVRLKAEANMRGES